MAVHLPASAAELLELLELGGQAHVTLTVSSPGPPVAVREQ